MFNRVKCRETNFAGTNASVSLATGVSAIKELGDTSVNSWVFETKNERRVAFLLPADLVGPRVLFYSLQCAVAPW